MDAPLRRNELLAGPKSKSGPVISAYSVTLPRTVATTARGHGVCAARMGLITVTVTVPRTVRPNHGSYARPEAAAALAMVPLRIIGARRWYSPPPIASLVTKLRLDGEIVGALVLRDQLDIDRHDPLGAT